MKLLCSHFLFREYNPVIFVSILLLLFPFCEFRDFDDIETIMQSFLLNAPKIPFFCFHFATFCFHLAIFDENRYSPKIEPIMQPFLYNVNIFLNFLFPFCYFSNVSKYLSRKMSGLFLCSHFYAVGHF